MSSTKWDDPPSTERTIQAGGFNMFQPPRKTTPSSGWSAQTGTHIIHLANKSHTHTKHDDSYLYLKRFSTMSVAICQWQCLWSSCIWAVKATNEYMYVYLYLYLSIYIYIYYYYNHKYSRCHTYIPNMDLAFFPTFLEISIGRFRSFGTFRCRSSCRRPSVGFTFIWCLAADCVGFDGILRVQ